MKSRAAINKITYNRFTDENGGRASYELDFPNGGMVYLVGNLIQQNRQTENSTMVTFGEKGLLHAANNMSLISNTIVNDHPYGGTFLRVSPGAERTTMANKLLIGRGRLPAAADCPDLINSYTQIGVNHQGSKSDENETKSL